LQGPYVPPDEREDIFVLGEEEDDGGIEAYIEDACHQLLEDERRAYCDMREIQGTLVPTLYGAVTYTSSGVSSAHDDNRLPPYLANGLLLEHLPGSTLKDFLDAALLTDPPSYEVISAVCDQAVLLMDRLDDFNVLNRDARLQNILVVPVCESNLSRLTIGADSIAASHVNSTTPSCSPSTITPPTYRLVAIDFACSRLRYHDETDEQWRRAKQSMDERGAVGAVAQNLLDRRALAREGLVDKERLWRYHRSTRWWRNLNEEEQAAYEDDPCWGLYGYN
jgi:hypothetical protein